MRVERLRAFADNYVFVLVDEAAREAAVVDPGDAQPVVDYLARERLQLTQILITHHHRDHIGGMALLKQLARGVEVYGAAADRARIPGLTELVGEGSALRAAGREGRVIETPGHTRGHLAFFFPAGDGGDLFSGDTLFGGTIGHLFEGTPDEMFSSLTKLRALPPATRIYCSHEYTLTYVREARGIDPGNAALAARLARLEAQAAGGEPTVPLTLAEELATNPYLRWDDPALQRRLGTTGGRETFLRLCEAG